MSKNNSNDKSFNWILEEFGNVNTSISSIEPLKPFDSDLIPPKEIVKKLDKYVIGHSKAKKLLATAVWNRMLALNNKYLYRDKASFYFEKSNVMLLGDTGTGKTHLIKSLGRILNIPVFIADATSLTSSGYVGESVDSLIYGLLDEAETLFNSNFEDSITMSRGVRGTLIQDAAEYGIIYIDEIDKLKHVPSTSGRDIVGKSIQEELLKMIEGKKFKSKYLCPEYVNTDNILFIFGGAFSDINDTVLKRVHQKQIGFQGVVKSDEELREQHILSLVEQKDLIQYGLMPEFIGRIPIITCLDKLDLETTIRILTEVNESILSQVINEFKSYGITVSFTDCAVKYIAEEALNLKIGARGLRSAITQMLLPILYNLPSHIPKTKIIVSKDMLLKFKEMSL